MNICWKSLFANCHFIIRSLNLNHQFGKEFIIKFTRACERCQREGDRVIPKPWKAEMSLGLVLPGPSVDTIGYHRQPTAPAPISCPCHPNIPRYRGCLPNIPPITSLRLTWCPINIKPCRLDILHPLLSIGQTRIARASSVFLPTAPLCWWRK